MQIKSGDEFIPKKQKAPKLNSDRIRSEEEKKWKKQELRRVAERGWRKAGR